MADPEELPDGAVVALPEAAVLGALVEDDPELMVAEGALELAAPAEGAAGAGAGCIAEEPVVAEPEALAAGRSVPPEGAGVV